MPEIRAFYSGIRAFYSGIRAFYSGIRAFYSGSEKKATSYIGLKIPPIDD